LVVPVIREAGKLSALQLTAEINRLSELARQNKLSIEDNSGGTFTITTLGAYEVDMFTPIINPPQVAILGVGRIADRAGVLNGQLAPRKLLWLSLSFDHRVVDGAPAAAFLKEVKGRLEQPQAL
ncbi:MAG: 2-oxo acid dehydrogenase subunit E2, partial [Microcystaceae cyanobacterium]